VLLVNLIIFTPRTRRLIAAVAARLILRLLGIRLRVDGLDRLPREPCIVVANHASFIDGVVATAALPPEFVFVIKKEMGEMPLAGTLLRGLGSEFVDRHDRKQGAADARRVLKRAVEGQSLVFFPEGTFSHRRQIGPFLRGAFATAALADRPIVAVALHGTRAALPPGSWRLRRGPIRVDVLETLRGPEACQRSRELIARALDDPLA